MSITLSSRDLEQLTEAIRILVSPLVYDGADCWRSAVNRHLRELLHADSAGFLLPISDGLILYSDEHDPNALSLYPEIEPPDAPSGTPGWQRLLEIGVGDLETTYEGDPDRYLKSAYYNEYAAPGKAHDTLALATAIDGDETTAMAMLQFWHSRPQGRSFGERELAIMRLLHPAFRAGVESYMRWQKERTDFVDALDRLGQAALMCDHEGRIVHVTPGLERLLNDEPEARRLQEELRSLAAEICLLTGRNTGGNNVPAQFSREVRSHVSAYRLRGCLYGAPSSGTLKALVSLERLGPTLPAHADLRERFGLTRRQAEVAILLIKRKTNAEIAQTLTISPHTARHHTESVLRKLGVKDRRLVEEVLRP